MKKSFLFSALFLGMGLFSCTQENLTEQVSQAGKPVTVSVQVPDGVIDAPVSRYMPSAPDEEHQLRCILFVQDGENTIRQEKIAEEAVNDRFYFTFTPSSEDYKCTFWADFIASDAAKTGEGTEARYADLYYNTQSLPTVSYVTTTLTDGSLFNNEACDAYCVSLANAATTGTLGRPFAKVSFSDEVSATVSGATEISVSYQVYDGFDIVNNTVSGIPSTISYTGPVADADNAVWFSNYLFVGNQNKLPGDGNISMSVTNASGTIGKTISTENLTLTPNQDINAHFDWNNAGDDVTVDVGFEDPNAPKVGQFLQKDGTFSDTYDAENSVAIVFASGAKGNDVATNYGKEEGTDIWGYAMGLTSTARTAMQDNAEAASMTPFPDLKALNGDLPWQADDYNGYVYTQKLMETVGGYSSLLLGTDGTFAAWKTANDVTSIANVSGWYIPSARQLLDIIGMTYGYAGGNDGTVSEVMIDPVTKNEALAAAVAAVPSSEEGKSYYGNHTSAANIMSSYIRGGRIVSVQTKGGSAETISQCLGVTVSSTSVSPFVIRPVLTIFEK